MAAAMDIHVPGTVAEVDDEDDEDQASQKPSTAIGTRPSNLSERFSGIVPGARPSPRASSRSEGTRSLRREISGDATTSAVSNSGSDSHSRSGGPRFSDTGSRRSRFRGSLGSLASGKLRWEGRHTRFGSAQRDCQDSELGPMSKFEVMRRRLVLMCRSLNKNRVFQGVMFIVLLLALFMPDLWVLADRPDSSDLDLVLTIVAVMFLFELTVQSIGMYRTYVRSFFFYMDILGLVSLMLDLSYLQIMSLLGGGGESGSGNAVVLRAARIAKLGARAGRFARLVKLLRFLPGMQEQGASAGAAKRLSARLVTSLSTRVSCLIIVMVVLMPLFSMWTFPEVDWSMQGWLLTIEKALLEHPERWSRQIGRFEEFYETLSYYPFRIVANAGANLSSTAVASLPWSSSRPAPVRPANIMRVAGDVITCEFNFQSPNQIDSLMSLCLLTVIMLLMVGFSCMLSNSVSAIVLTPLENLLVKIRQAASKIFQSVTDIAHNAKKVDEDSEDEEDDDQEVEPTNLLIKETTLLDKVVRKLSTLNEASNDREERTDGFQGLSDNDRAMISGFYGGQHRSTQVAQDSEDPLDAMEDFDILVEAQRTMVENAGLTLDLLNSWNLNPLELDKARNRAAAMYFVGPHNHGIVFDQVEMANFLDQAELGYVRTNPYHNWFHAIDIAHCVYRLLQIIVAEEFLNGVERYALALSAVCHDLGHPGLNNTFLVETSHDLALRYNDKSPLENMHSAKMFELLGTPKCNVFGVLSRPQFFEARKVCIEAILHTDNAQHFAMIKEIQVCTEVSSEVIQEARLAFREDRASFPSRDLIDMFHEPDTRRLIANLTLHIADISNSFKPFRISRIWAGQVLEEFFAQGDAEKRLGLPVQALNDREKVNRAFSQIGFIEFLVSPLLFATVKVLLPLEPHLELMLQNVSTWQQVWLTETKPLPTSQERSALEERMRKLHSKVAELQT